eukprot:GEMP01036815.1.p1 GENE.GEMP01036815.1~~GEMP01036815.1.p1  ORF type:complete len:594 (+),score=157.91 GEMP01036815.1:186-1967(+)
MALVAVRPRPPALRHCVPDKSPCVRVDIPRRTRDKLTVWCNRFHCIPESVTMVELSMFWKLASTASIQPQIWTTLIEETVRMQDTLDSAAIYVGFVSLTKMRHLMLPNFANMVCFLLERAQKHTDMQFKHLCGICGCIAKLYPQLVHPVVREEMDAFVQQTAESLPERFINKDSVAGQDLAYLCEALQALGMRSEDFDHLLGTLLRKDWNMIWSAHGLTLCSDYLRSTNPQVWKSLAYRVREVVPDMDAKSLRTVLTSFSQARAIDRRLFATLEQHLAARAYDLSAADLVEVSASPLMTRPSVLQEALLRLIPRRASTLSALQCTDVARALLRWPRGDAVRVRRAMLAVQGRLCVTPAVHQLIGKGKTTDAPQMLPVPKSEVWLEECALRRIRPDEEEVKRVVDRCLMTPRLARALFLLDYPQYIHAVPSPSAPSSSLICDASSASASDAPSSTDSSSAAITSSTSSAPSTSSASNSSSASSASDTALANTTCIIAASFGNTEPHHFVPSRMDPLTTYSWTLLGGNLPIIDHLRLKDVRHLAHILSRNTAPPPVGPDRFHKDICHALPRKRRRLFTFTAPIAGLPWTILSRHL